MEILKCRLLVWTELQYTLIKFSVSARSDSSPGRSAADHGGQRRSAGGLEGRRCRGGSGLLAHLGGAAAEQHRWPALLLLHAGRLPLDAADQHPPLGQSVRVAHLQDSAWRRTLLHGAVSLRWDQGRRLSWEMLTEVEVKSLVCVAPEIQEHR